MAKRKIVYYSIEYRLDDDTVGNTAQMLQDVVNHIIGLNLIDRKRENIDTATIYFMDSCRITDTKMFLLFKSARHSYRPPLVNRDNLNERDNPKTMEEGEVRKTHLVVDMNTHNLVLEAGEGMTMNNVIKYLNCFLDFMQVDDNNHGEFVSYSMPSDSFEEELNRLSRVTVAEMYVDKQILGSPALNFSNRMELIKEDVILTVKPQQRGGSLFEIVRNLLGRNGNMNDERIRRIRLRGKDEENNDVLLDSMNLIKKTSIEVEKDDNTGEYVSADMFAKLNAVL